MNKTKKHASKSGQPRLAFTLRETAKAPGISNLPISEIERILKGTLK